MDFEEEKYNQFNASENPFRLVPDQIFTLAYAQGGDNVNRVPLDLVGQPDAILYRSQEEAGGTEGEKIQALSGERVLLAARVKVGDAENIVVVDFGLDDTGVADIPQNVEVDDVNFARTAMHLNAETDAIILPEGVPDFNGSFTFGAWVKHNEGEGTLVRRGLDESVKTSTGFAIEWKPLEGKLIAYLGSAEDPVEIAAKLPTSHTWHHIGLVVVGENASLYIDGIKKSTAVGIAGFTATGETFIGGASGEAREGNWLDFEIDQIVLWGDGRAPAKSPMHITKYGIYSELSAAELADPALLGAWAMDDSHDGSATETADSSPHGNTAMIYGADHVNQTAPIFKTDSGNFEDRLTGMSIGMGLISIKDKSLIDDPTLFLSSDGLVHLYSSAAPGSRAEKELAVLQYDTTSTRTQFGVQWHAAVEIGGQEVKESGELLLTAKTPGPIMNRTIVELKNRGGAIKLKIHNPATGLVEIWKKLPK